MRPILETCQPRKDILAGSFNPEIFTASLSQVMGHYRGTKGVLSNLYTDAEAFFRDATFPTDGLKRVLQQVFGRLSGDAGCPAIHRLETSFGGGKTHTLIALTHLAMKGKELGPLTRDIIDSKLLCKPGEVLVVGVAGDKIPVHKPHGTKLAPYTLWGEIVHQIGGDALYKKLGATATSDSPPVDEDFEAVFGERKIIIMLDELAQYATRLEAARPRGGELLAAFLMSLNGYARVHSNLVVVMTLAGQQDAFSRQTEMLKNLVTEAQGKEVDTDGAIAIAQRADKEVRSVVSRDATTVVPVQAGEISRVLAKRLFTHIDSTATREVAAKYRETLEKCRTMLPPEATQQRFFDSIESHYPFHPKFIDFLNHKLASLETFQGTRGVLRVLSLAVRSIWERKLRVPLIHTCHLDLKSPETVNEIMGRTGANDLLIVLNTDVGGVDTKTIEGGRANAEVADEQNRHPEGHPMHEYTWKTVFLHSLVGRNLELGSPLFGINKAEALLEIAFPGLTPPQIEVALQKIESDAYYLRTHQGRYYASTDPSVNIALSRIRRGLDQADVRDAVSVMARNVVKSDSTFVVSSEVSLPEHVPDKRGKPILAVVSIFAGEIDVEAFVTTAGSGRPRHEQNLVFLLVPATVRVTSATGAKNSLFAGSESSGGSVDTMQRLEDLARSVLAHRRLQKNPENWGISRSKLAETEFDRKVIERDQGLATVVSQTYSQLWYPSSMGGQVIRKEIKTAGGEGGTPIMEEIRKLLRDDHELVCSDMLDASMLTNLGKIFFERTDTIKVAKLRENFACLRAWPVLESPGVFEQIIRKGVSRDTWCLFRMGDDESSRPKDFYSRETGEPPLDLDLKDIKWTLVTLAGARQRHWTKTDAPDPVKVEQWARSVLAESPAVKIADVATKVREVHGDVSDGAIAEAVTQIVKKGHAVSYRGNTEQSEKPTLVIDSNSTALHVFEPADIIITTAEAATRGWITAKPKRFELSGPAGTEKLLPLLKRLGSFYTQGAKSKIAFLDILNLAVKGGGRLRIEVSDATPEAMKKLAELFEVVANVTQKGDDTEVVLQIDEPNDECPLIKALK